MPIGFLTAAERARFTSFPRDIPREDVIAYFTLSSADRAAVPRTTDTTNRLGFALMLGTLRYLGFCPDLRKVPQNVLEHVACELGIPTQGIQWYGLRRHTWVDHRLQVQAHLGFRRPTAQQKKELTSWLVERALEHDRPVLLLELACDRLRTLKLLRPGLTRVERMVAAARQQARVETYRRVSPMLTQERRKMLDALLVADEETGRTPLSWLRQESTRNSPRSIGAALEKLSYMRPRLDGIDLSVLTPNHRKFLAQVGNKSSNRALALMNDERRYPILLAFLQRAQEQVIDETLQMFDRYLADTESRVGRKLKAVRLKFADATEDKVRMLRDILGLIADRSIPDDKLRSTIYDRVTEEVLLAAIAECDELARPEDGGHFDLLEKNYNQLRKFAPEMLTAFEFQSKASSPLLAAIETLRTLNATGRRHVPPEASLAFVPDRWRSYVVDAEGRIDRHGYELCALWQLRAGLRTGQISVAGSRSYANPESYLLPMERWPALRIEVCEQVGAPLDGAERFGERRRELEALLAHVDERLPQYDRVRMEDDWLVVPRSPADERPASLVELEHLVDERLPRLELAELLLEVDSWTGFSKELQHAAGPDPRTKERLVLCHASIFAQACNLGLARMAHAADLSYEKLAWTTRWYLREETLRAAYTRIVNYQYRLPLSRSWGDGTFSSSDGQRFVVPVHSRTATAIPRYFGYGRGLTAQTWTSDQFSQYGSKPTISTMRDARYVLDAILDNNSDLDIEEHTTDTAGYTDIIFALFDLVGLKYLPRLRDPGSVRLFRVDTTIRYQHIGPLLRGTVRPALILPHWDPMLRVAGSLKLGWVSASLLLSKLQSREGKHELAVALQEYGRLIKSIFLLRYIDDEVLRKRIGAQLNKGEALHALRRFLFFANEGQIRRAAHEDQVNQVSCLNLVANAVVTWNTVYMHAVLQQLRAEGFTVNDADVSHLSPVRFQHINPHGKYHFDAALAQASRHLRSLRSR